jgi:type I restriction enzyme R subunit
MSDSTARKYDPIALSAESTVVAEYVADAKAETSYQSEADLERELIRLLQSQAYEYLPLTSEAQIVANLRTQLEALNGISFSDAEWLQFFSERIAGANDGIVEKTVRIQEDHVQLLKRDDGSTKNILLIDKQNIHNNRLQVINQYAIDQGDGGAARSNRYDVTVLVNGLPMVHIELKRRGVDIREAFNQIDRYQRDSFWAGSGLFEYVQLFVISNGTLTKYYSNTTRRQHLSEAAGSKRVRKTSNSFEFTSWWADAQNKPITDLGAFAKTFFAKHSLLNILTKYCVLTADKLLLVMRPYQIVGTERILSKIDISTNYRQLGTIAAGGYVWHTTGSGKTLTSFKAAQLASKLPTVDKVLFVVDRKDLDYQTMREYDRFEKGAANSNTSTAVLKKQLEDPGARIIITTIQKLSTFIGANKGHAIYDGHVVIIFDECHRSQFGDMHSAITKAFKRYNLFGFTGTPIFAANSGRPPSRPSATSSTRTRSSTRSATRTCCPSASTTSTRLRSGTSSTSRCRRLTPRKRCSRRSGSARLWRIRWSTSIRRPSVPSITRSATNACAASTLCSRPHPSRPLASTTTTSSSCKNSSLLIAS